MEQSTLEENNDDFKSVSQTNSSGKITQILEVSIPAMFTCLIMILMEMVNLITLGHLDDPAILAGVGMGNVISNMLGLSIVIGFNGALQTIISQAYGAQKLELCGVYLNRARFIIICLFVPVFVILQFTEKILLAIGQNPEVAKNSQIYVLVWFPGLLLAGLNDSQRSFLQMTGNAKYVTPCQLTGVLIHILLCYQFVYVHDLAIEGVGYAGCISNAAIFLSLLVVSKVIPEISAVPQLPDFRIFNLEGIFHYLTLGSSSVLMICLEWWAFECMTLGSAYFGVVPQAVTILCIHIMGIFYMMFIGFRQGVQMWVGKNIGLENIAEAQEYIRVSNKLSLCLMIASTLGFTLFAKQIVHIFTDNAQVHSLFITILPFSGLTLLGDMLQAYLQGIVNAVGIQKSIIHVNLISYWLFHLPFSLILCAVFRVGYQGIWISLSFTMILICGQIWVQISKIDWDKVVSESKERRKNEEGE